MPCDFGHNYHHLILLAILFMLRIAKLIFYCLAGLQDSLDRSRPALDSV